MQRRKHQLDPEAIRLRAYEISEAPGAGTPEENWLRAEEQLRRPGKQTDASFREEALIERSDQSDLSEARVSALTRR